MKNLDLITVKGLRKSFWIGEEEITVLRGIDFRLGEGDLTVIVGASGVGKSTFLHILGTLDRPTEGEIFYQSLEISRMNGGQLAQFRNANLGFVFQFHHLLPEFTALENVMMPALIQGKKKEETEFLALEALKEVRLERRLRHRPSELSGGERQRVALARAIMLKPKVLLADEPTGNLDQMTGGVVVDLLFELHQKQHISMVVVTHNEQLARQAPCVLEMSEGKLS